MSALFGLVDDECMMKGRKDFAWEEARVSQGRRNNPGNKDRCFGGVPLRFEFGDVQQLPAVASKSLYDSAPNNPQSACAMGRMVF